MFVPLTADLTFWSKEEKNIIIEDCYWISHTPEELSDFDYEVFTIDFIDRGVDEKAMWSFIEELSNKAGRLLNEYHGTKYDAWYWRRALFIWLVIFAPMVYLRYHLLLCLERRYPGTRITMQTLSPEDEPEILLAVEEIHEREQCFNDATELYLLHIYTMILRLGNFSIQGKKIIRPSTCTHFTKNDLEEESSANKCFIKPNSFILRLVRNLKRPKCLLQKCLSRITKKIIANRPERVEVLFAGIGDPVLTEKLRIHSKGKILRIDNFFLGEPARDNLSFHIDEEFRRQASLRLKQEVAIYSDCDKVFRDSFFEEIPCCYIELFTKYKDLNKDIYERYPNLKYIISWGGFLHTYPGLALLEQGERGIKNIWVQHGGLHPNERNLFRQGKIMADIHYGWGEWELEAEPNIIDYHSAPPYKLFLLYGSMQRHFSNDIIYVGDFPPLLSANFDYHTLSTLLDKETHFLASLSTSIRSKILVRNYPFSFLKDMDRWIKYRFPDVRVSRKDEINNDERDLSFSKILYQCRLCILDHVETPFHEVLYIKKPFLLILAEKEMADTFSYATEHVYVQMMQEAGLLHANPEEAAKYLETIYQDIDQWWRDEKRQQVIEKLRIRYLGREMNEDRWWYQKTMGLIKRETTMT